MSKPRLERIFIRVQGDDGKWGNSSLTEATDEQFERWFGMYVASRLLSNNSREDCIRLLDDLGMSPVELKDV